MEKNVIIEMLITMEELRDAYDYYTRHTPDYVPFVEWLTQQVIKYKEKKNETKNQN